MRNPGFLPRSLFDRYTVRTVGSGGVIEVKNIQTVSGAERKVRELARKYPCVGIEIRSEKLGTVVKSYKPSMTGAAPQVDQDNAREYRKQEKQRERDAVRFALYIDGQEYASYDTKREAEQVGRKEGAGKMVKVKEVVGNPVSGVPTEDAAFTAGRKWYIAAQKSTRKVSGFNWKPSFEKWLYKFSGGDYLAALQNYGASGPHGRSKYEIAKRVFDAFSNGVLSAETEFIRRGYLPVNERKPVVPGKVQNSENPSIDATPNQVRIMLETYGIRPEANGMYPDFHSLRSFQVTGLLSHDEFKKYKAPRNASGSRGRYLYEHLVKIATRKTNPHPTAHHWDGSGDEQQLIGSNNRVIATISQYKVNGVPRGVMARLMTGTDRDTEVFPFETPRGTPRDYRGQARDWVEGRLGQFVTNPRSFGHALIPRRDNPSGEKTIYILTYTYANGTRNREYFTVRADADKQLRKYQGNHKGGHGEVVATKGTGIHPPFDTIRGVNNSVSTRLYPYVVEMKVSQGWVIAQPSGDGFNSDAEAVALRDQLQAEFPHQQFRIIQMSPALLRGQKKANPDIEKRIASMRGAISVRPVGGSYNVYIDAVRVQTFDNKAEADRYKAYLIKQRREFAKRNPESDDNENAADLFEQFHGVQATGEVIYKETFEVPDTFAELGDLIELKIATIHGKDVTINAPDPDGGDLTQIVKLASTSDGRQLYFIGGDQTLDLEKMGFTESEERHKMMIGVLYELTYRTKKKFHKLKLTDYYHKLGEDTKNQPFLIYNPYTEHMGIAGGDYHVKPEGIVN